MQKEPSPALDRTACNCLALPGCLGPKKPSGGRRNSNPRLSACRVVLEILTILQLIRAWSPASLRPGMASLQGC